MRKHILSLVSVGLILGWAGMAPAEAKPKAKPKPEVKAEVEWKEWKNDKFGIKMTVPKNMALAGKEYDGGWGGLYGKLGVVEMFVIGKLDATHTLEEMQTFCIVVSGVKAKFWKKIDEGEKKNGWKWHKTYEANGPARALFAILAQSEKGSFIIFLRTTHANFLKHIKSYETWYKSIKAY
ncbi:MAG: hypothetical protein ABIJ56_19220 [Pseudomonadota bacterium]